MDLSTTTRNETIRALAAEIRSRSDRALRAHAAVAGEIVVDPALEPGCMTRERFVEWACDHRVGLYPRTTDRPLPLERTPNHFTGAHRDEVVR